MKLAVDNAQRYAREISKRRVAPSEAAVAALAALHEPFPTSPSDPSAVIARLDCIGSRQRWLPLEALLRFRERRNGSGSPGRQLVGRDVEPKCGIARDVSHRGGIGGSSPSLVCEALGLPRECAGGLVTSATMATLHGTCFGRVTLF